MKLNEQQMFALSSLMEWWGKHSSPLFQISGAAGTGKTTIIRYLIKEIGLNNDEVLFVAYVGKATLAMSMNGLNAQTIHSAICDYEKEPIIGKNGRQLVIDDKAQYKFIFHKKESLNPKIKLIVVDEGAMVPEKLAEWLMSYKIPIIVLGDLNQLPPVMGKSYFLQKPDVVLTQIMRQSKDSPIPYLAKMVVDGNIYFDREVIIANKIVIMKKKRANEFSYTDPDIVICPNNHQRDELNNFIRRGIYKRTNDYPIIGDKLICRENDWNRLIRKHIYLINGMIGYVSDIHLETLHRGSVDIDFRPEFLKDDIFYDVTLDRTYLNLSYEDKRNYFSYLDKFEYGYAITCHLAQGSQYKNVLVDITELRGRRSYIKQWLYTAITRAIDKLTILI